MGRLDGKVSLVTGAAHGQGRAHCLRLAEEGSDVIGIDICRPVGTLSYDMGSRDGFDETGRLVEKLGRRAVMCEGDVRDLEAVEAAVEAGLGEFGRLDNVIANAGVTGAFLPSWEIPTDTWNATLDINVTGVWHTARAAIPRMLALGNGGSIVLVGSALAAKATLFLSDYVASKHAVIGLMKTMALELAGSSIRVNTILPGIVKTPMVTGHSQAHQLMGLNEPSESQLAAVMAPQNLLPISWLEAVDIANAALFLVSDEARYITGSVLPVDAGYSLR